MEREVVQTDADRYVIVEYLAEGGMGAIFLGKKVGMEGFEKEVVLKQLLPEFTSQPEFIDLFLREAKLSATLDHANIVHTIDLVAAGDDFFIVMEYVRGGDLRTLLKRIKLRGKTLHPAAAMFIAREVLSALAYAHDKKNSDGSPLKLIHRDISPSNIMVSGSGEVKLTDFGIAKVSTHKSVFYRVKGKVGYMSPEQAYGDRPLDHRSDLYSLAVCLFEMLSGERLFVADLLTTADQIYSQPVPRLEGRPGMPQGIDRVLAKALSFSPDERYQTALSLQDGLINVAYENAMIFTPPDLAAELHRVCGPDPKLWSSDAPEANASPPHPGTELLPSDSTHFSGVELTSIFTGGPQTESAADFQVGSRLPVPMFDLSENSAPLSSARYERPVYPREEADADDGAWNAGAETADQSATYAFDGGGTDHISGLIAQELGDPTAGGSRLPENAVPIASTVASRFQGYPYAGSAYPAANEMSEDPTIAAVPDFARAAPAPAPARPRDKAQTFTDSDGSFTLGAADTAERSFAALPALASTRPGARGAAAFGPEGDSEEATVAIRPPQRPVVQASACERSAPKSADKEPPRVTPRPQREPARSPFALAQTLEHRESDEYTNDPSLASWEAAPAPKRRVTESHRLLLILAVVLLLFAGLAVVMLVGLTGPGLEDPGHPPRAPKGELLPPDEAPALESPATARPGPEASALPAGDPVTTTEPPKPRAPMTAPATAAPPAAGTKPKLAPPRGRYLRVTSVPTGAQVYLDDVLQCQTPCTVESLARDKIYLLSVRKRQRISWSSLVDTANKAGSALNARLATEPASADVGYLTVHCHTPAEVFVDGKELGRVTSEGRIPLAPGQYEISLRHPRKTSRVHKVVLIRARKTTLLRVKF